MICDRDLKAVGKLLKPHGINGEIVASLTCDVDLEALSCIILDIDGIFVPFFLTGVRPKSSETDLVSIDGIENERQSAALCGRVMYALASDLPAHDADGDGGFYADDLVGYDVVANGSFLGKITALEDSTANYLFIIEKADGSGCLIPVADEFIDDINTEIRTVYMDVPEELLHL